MVLCWVMVSVGGFLVFDYAPWWLDTAMFGVERAAIYMEAGFLLGCGSEVLDL